MVLIRQHGNLGELFDMNTFFTDFEILRHIEEWKVSIQECLGEGALAIENRSSKEAILLTYQELREIYRGIYQTIDGSFVGIFQGLERCRFEAIDSSFWKVSGPVELESQMVEKYGAYVLEDV